MLTKRKSYITVFNKLGIPIEITLPVSNKSVLLNADQIYEIDIFEPNQANENEISIEKIPKVSSQRKVEFFYLKSSYFDKQKVDTQQSGISSLQNLPIIIKVDGINQKSVYIHSNTSITNNLNHLMKVSF